MANLARAYLLIETQPGESNAVLEALEALDQTVQVDRVTGPYDIICVVETESLDEIGGIVHNDIHVLNGITRTMTSMRIST
jgi:DNA-binding Lrp family transcriptional regulator